MFVLLLQLQERDLRRQKWIPRWRKRRKGQSIQVLQIENPLALSFRTQNTGLVRSVLAFLVD